MQIPDNSASINALTQFLTQQVPSGVLLVFLQDWLKRQKWFPWVNYEAGKANHFLAIALTGLTSVGIHVTHTGTFTQGGAVLIAWPASTVLFAGLWHWAQQYGITKG